MCKIILELTLWAILTLNFHQPAIAQFSQFSGLGPERKIVGGINIDITTTPYQVSIQKLTSNSSSCGGSILTPSWIITAAHCVDDSSPENKKVVVGLTRLSEGGIIHSIKTVVQHPLYGFAHTLNFDLALVELDESIEFNERAQPIRLPEDDEPPLGGDICSIQGWGRLWQDGARPDHLQYTYLPLLEPEECAASYKYIEYLFVGDTPTMICTLWEEGGSDTCTGDSGGGLVCGDALYGIVSFGKGCFTKYPKVFTNVYNMRGFIQYVIFGDMNYH